MRKFVLSAALLVAFCGSAMAQSASVIRAEATEEKLKVMRAEMKELRDLNAQIITMQTQQGQQLNGISTVQARMQSDVMDLKEQVDKLSAKLDAVIAATNTAVTSASTTGWNGTTTFSATSGHAAQPPPMAQPQMMYSSQMVGQCAGGQCNVSTGRGRRGR